MKNVDHNKPEHLNLLRIEYYMYPSKSILFSLIVLSTMGFAQASEIDLDTAAGLYHVQDPSCLLENARTKGQSFLVVPASQNRQLIVSGPGVWVRFNKNNTSETTTGDDAGAYVDKSTESYKDNTFSTCTRRAGLIIFVPYLTSSCYKASIYGNGTIGFKGLQEENTATLTSNQIRCKLVKDADQSIIGLAKNTPLSSLEYLFAYLNEKKSKIDISEGEKLEIEDGQKIILERAQEARNRR
ncbi:MAG: hypothetical protein H7235_05135 [Bdellovibrionaceae bacterium]|nr:hypothetical protein [Pseudobdellovibrionaceae bacterium]